MENLFKITVATCLIIYVVNKVADTFVRIAGIKFGVDKPETPKKEERKEAKK